MPKWCIISKKADLLISNLSRHVNIRFFTYLKIGWFIDNDSKRIWIIEKTTEKTGKWYD